MVLKNYQILMKITSNTINGVAFCGGWKCPCKIHFNTQCRVRVTLPRKKNIMANKLGGSGLNRNELKWIIGTHGNWKKINILGAVLELPAKQHCPFSPFAAKMIILRVTKGFDTVIYVITLLCPHFFYYITLNSFVYLFHWWNLL